jgi:hypothetical protein
MTVYGSKAMGWTPSLMTASMCRVEVSATTELRGASALEITTVGVDLAKNLYQVRAGDERSRVVLHKQLRREQMVDFFARHFGRNAERVAAFDGYS